MSESYTSRLLRQRASVVMALTVALLVGAGCAAEPKVSGSDRPGRPHESSPGSPQPAPSVTAVMVPPSIDLTGTDDVSEALNAFIADVPDGSRIDFDAGGEYRLSRGLDVWGKNSLVFEGNGATLAMEGFDRSVLEIMSSSEIVVRDCRSKATTPTPALPTPTTRTGRSSHMGSLSEARMMSRSSTWRSPASGGTESSLAYQGRHLPIGQAASGSTTARSNETVGWGSSSTPAEISSSSVSASTRSRFRCSTSSPTTWPRVPRT